MNSVFLGLESGGTKLGAILIDDHHRTIGFLHTDRLENDTAVGTLASIIRLGRELLDRTCGEETELTGIGWGFGGPVDRKLNRPVANFHETGWENLGAVEQLQAEFGKPVVVENDCKVAALAEAWHGAGCTSGLMAYLTLGSGVGGALVRHGEILELGRFGEMEIGHIELVPNGAACACGRRGCVEAYCSGWGLGDRAHDQALRTSADSRVAHQMLNCARRDRARVILAHRETDPFATRVFEEFQSNLARVCLDLVLTVAPGRIVIGGGVSKTRGLVESLARAVHLRVPPHLERTTSFHTSALNETAVPLGAALLAQRRMAFRKDLLRNRPPFNANFERGDSARWVGQR